MSFPGVPESVKILLEELWEKVERVSVRKCAGLVFGVKSLVLRV